ncbi:NrfD/PsrC family molybdoenzyme membrane anchor subunit [Paraferrimonas sedimenticola]|uniref:Polysulfide reductase n=1 Tax=Paraferrimonas sedimenticola TaxID=375674 RepID=A0AA37RWL6_9GAMM|nr:NrfD/PsrC family molybdoenzyme membrane anchor subunit [Paraferrimonas sedimenticola]GLP97055.1 polysulfide reductase [Paraferrimonas sedimenticola]
MNNIWGDMSQYDPVTWNWIIAVYLFLAGLSAGSLLVGLVVNWLRGGDSDYQAQPLLKAAALIAPIAICLGMLCLVLDLTKPFDFWVILVNYNLESVMSLGVIVLLVYIPLSFVFALMVFHREVAQWVPSLAGLTNSLLGYKALIERSLFVLAIAVAAYTGFLISALTAYPLLNTAALPALFLFSALSAGAAANSLVGILFFGAHTTQPEMKTTHALELPVVSLEILFLVMLFATLYLTGGASALALAALSEGVWAQVFWIGVVGIGFGVPLMSGLLPSKTRHLKATALTVAFASLVGVLALRHFIIYAGQTYTL